MNQPLAGKIALVAGATRGAGRGIACMLGEAGATVYCTGRSVRGNLASGKQRPETIDETAEMVTGYGGMGIAARCDHSDPAQVQALIERVRSEQGRLDILVNDIWGGDDLMDWDKPFWQQSLENGLLMLTRGVHTHIITNHYAAPLLAAQGSGLIVEITDGDSDRYRSHLLYDLAKASVIRLAYGLSIEMKRYGVTVVAVTPGFLRSEAMLERFGVSEANWQDGAKVEPHFIASETPYFVGRAVAALAADPNVAAKNGGVYASWTLSDEYGFRDIDGRRPHWGRHFDANVAHLLDADGVYHPERPA
jgi:NAD(P)-dependent dehydrogenase (short-subunit alcohol dehydrogenase family)